MASNPQKHGTLVVVGSGPVGMVSALLLKDRFERIVVLEKQSKERFLRTRGFTFPIVFSPAAIRVLQDVDVWDAISSERSRYFGVIVHKQLLGRDITWTAKNEGIYSHWRNHIIKSLHDRLTEEAVEVHFEAEVTSIDFERQVVTETSLGSLDYTMLLGADGMHSRTRSLLGADHPEHDSSSFTAETLDRWHAYQLPAVGELASRFGMGDHGWSSHVHVDNLPTHPDDKFRVITVAMENPEPVISVVLKHGPDVSNERLRELNATFFSPYVDHATLEAEFTAGVGGDYRHVNAPTFRRGSALLVGDAAHGFEGNGDLINLGLASVGALPDLLGRHTRIPEALTEYDATVGSSLRDYSDYAMRRSLEQINFEVAAFELGALLKLNRHHPSMWGIYEDDFDLVPYMERYQRDRRRTKVQAVAMAAGLLLAIVGLRSRRR